MELEEIRELLARIATSLKIIESTQQSMLETEKAILAALSNPPATAIGNLFGAPKP